MIEDNLITCILSETLQECKEEDFYLAEENKDWYEWASGRKDRAYVFIQFSRQGGGKYQKFQNE